MPSSAWLLCFRASSATAGGQLAPFPVSHPGVGGCGGRRHGLGVPREAAVELVSNLVAQLPREQPAYAKHIDRGAHRTVPETIFARPKAAGTMIDRNFHQAVAGAFDQRGDKTMHALEGNEGAHTLAPHGLERATSVAHSIFRKTAADEIGNSTR